MKADDTNVDQVGPDAPGPATGEPETGGWLRIVLAELALVALILVGVGVLVGGANGADPNDSFAAPKPATVSLANLPSAMADTYQYAADHAEHFMAIPCFCGCQQSLGHRSLEDCFVTPGGDWDAHASGCGVCTAEAIAAKELLDSNTPINEVRRVIVARFGPPPTA
jgi:hypothetical protein